MSEHNEEQQQAAATPVVPDDPHGDTPEVGAERPGLSARTGWRERAYGIKGVAAVAVAGLIIGGGAGAAIHAATGDDDGRDGRPAFGRDGGGRGDGFGGPGQGRMPGQGGMPGPGGMPGQDGMPGQGPAQGQGQGQGEGPGQGPGQCPSATSS